MASHLRLPQLQRSILSRLMHRPTSLLGPIVACVGATFKRSITATAAIAAMGVATLVSPLFISTASAQSATNRDLGPTLTSQFYLADAVATDSTSNVSMADTAVSFPLDSPQFKRAATQLLDLKSNKTPFANHLIRPVAIIKDDAYSHAWLQKNGNALRANQVTILIGSVKSKARVEALRKEHAGLSFAASNLSSFAAQLAPLGLAIYPLVIWPNGLATSAVAPVGAR
jgi:hypothetical protein